MGDYPDLAAHIEAVVGADAIALLQRKLETDEYQNNPTKTRETLLDFFDDAWRKGLRRKSRAGREKHPTARLQQSRLNNFHAFLEKKVLSRDPREDGYFEPRGQAPVDWRGLRQAYLDSLARRPPLARDAVSQLLAVLDHRKFSGESRTRFKNRVDSTIDSAAEENDWKTLNDIEKRLNKVVRSGKSHQNLRYDDAAKLAASIEKQKARHRPREISNLSRAWKSKTALAKYLDEATTKKEGRQKEPLGILQKQVQEHQKATKPTPIFFLARKASASDAADYSVSETQKEAALRRVIRQNPVLASLPAAVEDSRDRALVAERIGLPNFEEEALRRVTGYQYSFTPHGRLLARPTRTTREPGLPDLVAAASFTKTDYKKVIPRRGKAELPYETFQEWQKDLRKEIDTSAEVLAERAARDDDLALMASGASYALWQTRQHYTERRET